MKEKTVIVVMQPRDRLWSALCERTCELARYLDGIESAELISTEKTPKGLTRQVQFWRAKANVPALLAPHIDANLLEWTGRIEWRDNDYKSRWIVEPKYTGGKILCEAVMDFSPAVGGKGTRLNLDLEMMEIAGSVGFQTIMKTILASHFRKLVDAATQLIEET